jgi:hypothetical protein
MKLDDECPHGASSWVVCHICRGELPMGHSRRLAANLAGLTANLANLYPPRTVDPACPAALISYHGRVLEGNPVEGCYIIAFPCMRDAANWAFAYGISDRVGVASMDEPAFDKPLRVFYESGEQDV